MWETDFSLRVRLRSWQFYCHKNNWLLLQFLWKIVFMALNNDIYGNSLFTCLSAPPPAFFKAIKMLQSNVTGSNSPKDSHILQSLVKYAAQAEKRESSGRQRKRQEISVVPHGCWSLPGYGECSIATQSIGFGTGLTQVKMSCFLPESS